MAELEHWDDETVSRIRRALANGISGPWLDDDSIRAVLAAADAVPAERLEGAAGAIGDAIQLLQGYVDGDAVDARALLKAAHAKFAGADTDRPRKLSANSRGGRAVSGAWQDRIPEQLIEAILESDELVTFTDEWRALSGNEQLDHARSWLREALGLEAFR